MRARPSTTIACALTCAGLVGCATVGNGAIASLDDATARTLLIVGTTRVTDVRTALGQGDVIHFDSGVETWHYLYREGLGAGWDAVPYMNLIAEHMHSPTKELVLLFDAQGTLRRWSFDLASS
jgi:hypothetical protein